MAESSLIPPAYLGFSQPLRSQIAILSGILARMVGAFGGSETIESLEAMAADCQKGRGGTDYTAVERRIRRLDNEQILNLLRASLAWFELLNAAEQEEITRVNRARMAAGVVPDSLDQAIATLRRKGASLDEVEHLLNRLDIQPTLTAHPTETRRRTTNRALRRIRRLLEIVQRSDKTWMEEAVAFDDLANEAALLICTDDLRVEKPRVKLEVERGLDFLVGPIWDSVPEIYRFAQHAVQRHYDAELDIPAFLRFRSWIGGDRDGNPYVTPELTGWTLKAQRAVALRRHLDELERLQQELSVSDRRVPISVELRRSLAVETAEARLDQKTKSSFQREPYRLEIAAMKARIVEALDGLENDGAVSRSGYDIADYIRDLELIKESLDQSGLGHVAGRGRLQRTLWLARTFGFHLAALDIRQHSAVHEEAVAALLKEAGVAADYSSLSEDERREVLAAALHGSQPMLRNSVAPPEAARRVLAVLEVVRDATATDRECVAGYVISMAASVSDVLEVLLLAKEVGLWRVDGENGGATIDVIPLFETVEDLAGVDDCLAALFADPVYRRHLAARGRFQEIMIGYSDSNKDGGYWMANWLLYRAQKRIGEVCREHDVAFRVFHGRGGSLERGGGLENEKILTAAPACHNGRLRFTEQGEVISHRYASVALACRHLEQVAHTVLLAMRCDPEKTDSTPADTMKTFEVLGQQAMDAYRGLIKHPDFLSWYARATPIRHIGSLPIASRPVSRDDRQDISLDQLRAIPWVFAWRQSRYAVPGWFGLGKAVAEGQIDIGDLRALFNGCAFFRLIVDNALREMARARMDIARHYNSLSGPNEKFHDIIRKDFSATHDALLSITGQAELLDEEETLRGVIGFRNPFVDVVNLLQVEIMRRHNKAGSRSRNELDELLPLSILCIAAAMESTG